jgi:hypothetical protein
VSRLARKACSAAWRPRSDRHRQRSRTQYLDEADQLAGRIAVIDDGKAIAEGTPADLKAWNPTSSLAAACRQLFGNPNPAATVVSTN